MIVSLGNKIAKDIWEADKSKALPQVLWKKAKAIMTIMHSTEKLMDLKIKNSSNLRLHKLKGNRRDDWSVTIKLPWCITFKFKNNEFFNVKIENYHRG